MTKVKESLFDRITWGLTEVIGYSNVFGLWESVGYHGQTIYALFAAFMQLPV